MNALTIAWMGYEAWIGVKHYVISLGDFGGFCVGETMLILDSTLVVVLMVRNRDQHPPAARPLLYTLIGFFGVGLVLASAGNEQVGGRFFSYHARWHVVGAFGFIVFWDFNQARFTNTLPRGHRAFRRPADLPITRGARGPDARCAGCFCGFERSTVGLR